MAIVANTTAVTASATVVSGGCLLHGWNFAENAAAAARVLIRDGGSGGEIIVDIHLADDESTGTSYPHPIRVNGDLYAEVNSGSVRGSVYTSPLKSAP